MFKQYLVIFLHLFICINSTIVSQETTYINYHLKIDEAENYIKQAKYDSAIIKYEELQKRYSRFFYKDLHNLSMCYLKLNNINKTLKIAEKIILQGYELKDFERYPSFRNIMFTGDWDKLVRKYPLLRKQYIANNNTEQREKIYNICLNDEKGTKNSVGKVQDSVSYLSGKQLESMFIQQGFPKFMTNKDSLSRKMMVVIRHYFRVKYTLESFSYKAKDSPYNTMEFNEVLDSLLKDALYNGYILPNHYVSMVTYDCGNNPYGTLVVNFNFNTETISLGLHPPTGYDSINTKRKSIGLAPINPADTNSLKHTWYRFVSIANIKDALRKCDTCKSMYDYLHVCALERNKIRELYATKEFDEFILEDILNINQFYNIGLINYLRKELELK